MMGDIVEFPKKSEADIQYEELESQQKIFMEQKLEIERRLNGKNSNPE